MKKILFTFVLLFLFVPFVYAKDVTIYLFHSSTCSHCKEEIKYLKSLDNIEIKYYEVFEEKSFYNDVREKLSIKEPQVPLTIIGSDYVIGYSNDIKNAINDMIDSYSKKDYCDAVKTIIDGGNIDECLKQNEGIYSKSKSRVLTIFGHDFKFNTKSVSLPLISLLIGFVDGFNPCAMWVLIFLISMLIGMENRKKMWALGLTFLVTSALVYLVFMLSIFTIANSFGSIFKYLIALVALIGGILNLRSFIRSLKKDVGCEVTSKDQKKKTINKIKNIISEKNFVIALLGIVLLAISVNFVELACSAGLPTMFAEILSINKLNVFEYSFYMFLYILMFMIDDIIIFIIAMTTLKVTGISNKYTKYSHLVGGILMLIIGILMIFKMEWLMFNF